MISPEEKRGGSIVQDPFGERLEDLMNTWKVIDIKPKKGKYTWSNKRFGPGHIAVRLGRILVSSSFLDLSILPSSTILPSAIFDHSPISLDLSPIGNLGPLPFRFSSTWIKEPGFLETVQTS